jgi:hypothetical protein
MPYGKKTAYKKGCFKMKGPSLYKFNAGLRKASAEGKLDNNPKFKAAVDAAPMKKYKSDAQRKAVHASKAEQAAMKKKGCKSAYKMLNKRNKSNKPCTGCKTICPSCRGKK